MQFTVLEEHWSTERRWVLPLETRINPWRLLSAMVTFLGWTVGLRVWRKGRWHCSHYLQMVKVMFGVIPTLLCSLRSNSFRGWGWCMYAKMVELSRKLWRRGVGTTALLISMKCLVVFYHYLVVPVYASFFFLASIEHITK